jgi:hypothetical protein
MEKILPVVVKFLYDTFQREARVISVSPQGDDWCVKAEIIEEDEYMQRRGRREILGLYEVILNSTLEIISFSRKALKERGTVELHDSEEG